MKQKYIKPFLILLVGILSAACTEKGTDDDHTRLSISLDLPDNQISDKGGAFTLRINTIGKWTATIKEPWCKLHKNEGTGSSSVVGVIAGNNTDKRMATITIMSNGETQNLTLIQSGRNGESPNPDPNPDPEPEPDPEPDRPSGYAGRIEIPKLKGGNMNLFYTHTSNYNGKAFITYSAEYDCTKKHTRWVAFTFDNVSNKKNTNRSDKWGNDPKIPSAYQTYASDYDSPYNKGHLVASADRYVTREANVQTFYYSNMSPQIVKFNGGIWNQMEEKVRTWAGSLSATDTVYVVKGGKIDGNIADGTLIEYTGNQVAVPRNYFMAILSLKGGATKNYKAIAFYIDQKTYTSNSISSYVLSIDKLEQNTGIDFFHNLPKNIEEEVERSYNKSDWGL